MLSVTPLLSSRLKQYTGQQSSTLIESLGYTSRTGQSRVFPTHQVPFANRASTFSRWDRFLRWTRKFSADMSGPGVYSLPGQSKHRIRGRKKKRTFGGMAAPGCGMGAGLSVLLSTAL